MSQTCLHGDSLCTASYSLVQVLFLHSMCLVQATGVQMVCRCLSCIILHGCWSRVPIMVLWSSSLLVMLWRVLSYVATEAVVAWHSAQVGICVIVGFWWKKTPEVLTDVCYILFGVRLCCLVLSPVTIFQACTGLFRAGWSAAVRPKRLIKNIFLESYCHILFLQSYMCFWYFYTLTASHLSTGSGC